MAASWLVWLSVRFSVPRGWTRQPENRVAKDWIFEWIQISVLGLFGFRISAFGFKLMPDLTTEVFDLKQCGIHQNAPVNDE
jgi:hypothetical protein